MEGFSWNMHPLFPLLICTILSLPQCDTIVVVQSYEGVSTESNARMISINISREIIQNEVQHNLKLIEEKIKLLQDNYNILNDKTVSKEKEEKNELKLVKRKLKIKNELLCEILNHQKIMDQELNDLRNQLQEMKESTKMLELNLTGIQERMSNLKQAKNHTPKVKSEENHQSMSSKAHNFNYMGIPEWVRNIKRKQVNLTKDHCSVKPQYAKGIPQWVKSIKIERLQHKCGKKKQRETKTLKEVIVQESYEPQKGDNGSSQYSDEPDTDASSKQSQKPTKWNIDEIILNLKHSSRIHFERIRYNITHFIDHAAETGKLCSLVMLMRNWDDLENCKEKIGINLTFSFVAALLTTVFVVVSFFVLIYLCQHARKAASYVAGSVLPQLSKIKDGITTTTTNVHKNMVKQRKISIKSFITSSPEANLGIVSSTENADETAKHLVARILESDNDLHQQSTPLFYTIQDFLMVKKTDFLPKYIVVIDLENALQSEMFDDVNGKNCVKYKTATEIMAQSDMILLSINDLNSKQLPRGKLHNKSLASANDSHLIRTLCRNDKFISINKEFTASQASRITDWLKL